MKKIKFDGPVALATGKSRKETHWKNKNMMYSELVEKLRHTMRTPETYIEYKKSPKTDRDRIKDVGGFVGGSLKNGRRKAENVANRTLLTLDLDYINGDIWSSIELLWDFSVTMYSTHTHTPDNQRLRLVIPLLRPVLPDEYQAIARKLAEDLGIDQFDDTTYEPSRLMYWPSTSCDGEYVFKVQDLAWLNPDEVLERYKYGWKDISYWPESSRATAKITRAIKKQEDPLEKRGIIGAFCRTYSIPEAIEEFLDDVYTACADDTRYTLIEGSSFAGLKIYKDKFTYSHHSTDPTSNQLCNAFDLVRIHKYGELDDEVKEGTPANRIPSFIKMSEFASCDKKVKIQLGQDAIEKATKDFDPVVNSDWMEQLSYTDKGILEYKINNFRLIIENHPELKGKIKYNEFSDRALVTGSMPWNKETEMREWQDNDDYGLRQFLDLNYIDPKLHYLAAVSLAFESNVYNPVKDYFEALTWDGVKRVDNLLIDYFNSTNNDYNKFVMRKWLVAGVKRVYEKGAKFDNMIVLSGATDIGKSSFFSILAGAEWFTDSLKTSDDKIVMEIMGGKLIAEFGELSGMKKSDVESIKHFLTKQEFRARLAFGHRTSANKIHWIYAGTTNKKEFLKDKTGNRRFWPVNVFRGKKNLWKELPNERDQIWAEAYQLYKDGEDINLTLAEKLLANKQQDEHMEIDEVERAVLDLLDWNAPQEKWREKTHTDIVSMLRLTDRQKGQANRDLKAILLKSGVHRHIKSSGSFYKVPPLVVDDFN